MSRWLVRRPRLVKLPQVDMGIVQRQVHSPERQDPSLGGGRGTSKATERGLTPRKSSCHTAGPVRRRAGSSSLAKRRRTIHSGWPTTRPELQLPGRESQINNSVILRTTSSDHAKVWKPNLLLGGFRREQREYGRLDGDPVAPEFLFIEISRTEGAFDT